MAQTIFFISGLGAIAGAIATVALRNPFYSVLALVCHLLCLAALFLLLNAEFVAATQVTVYAGAVMVLYVFVVSYVGPSSRSGQAPMPIWLRRITLLALCALVTEFLVVVIGSNISGLHSVPKFLDAFGSPEAIGRALLTRFLLPFELSSLLLLVAVVGAVVLARRKEEGVASNRVSVEQLIRGEFLTPTDSEVGSMTEAGRQHTEVSRP